MSPTTYGRTEVRDVQHLINVWFAHRHIPYPVLALDGEKGAATNTAISRVKKCFGWRGSNTDDTIGPKFLSVFAMKLQNGHLVKARRYRSNPAQIARGIVYRRKLTKSLQNTEPAIVGRAYAASDGIDIKNLPYIWGGGHAHAGTPDGGTGRDPGIGYDCSGSCGAVLAEAEMGYVVGQSVPGSGDMESWGVAGVGKFMTLWASSDHVWIQWHLKGKAWRFDTSPHNSGPFGPHQRSGARSTAGFVPRHWPGC